jgi:hypothetical protein
MYTVLGDVLGDESVPLVIDPGVPATITVVCSHGDTWVMPTGWRIEGVTAFVCKDGEDVLAVAFPGGVEGGLTMDTTG